MGVRGERRVKGQREAGNGNKGVFNAAKGRALIFKPNSQSLNPLHRSRSEKHNFPSDHLNYDRNVMTGDDFLLF